jgi:hypothetical protein
MVSDTGPNTLAGRQIFFRRDEHLMQKWLQIRTRPTRITLAGALLVFTAGLSGCERKEKVFELDTPGGGVEIERSSDGSVDIEVDNVPERKTD